MSVAIVAVLVVVLTALCGFCTQRLLTRRAALDVEINTLEAQLHALHHENDAARAAISEMRGGLALQTPEYDYPGEGSRAKRRRLLQEIEEARPTRDLTNIAALTATSYGRALLSTAEGSGLHQLLADRAAQSDQPWLDPAFEWHEEYEFGSAQPFYLRGACKHPSEFVEPVRLGGDESDGPIVAHLCTKCGSQLPGEGEYA